jgi:hypothetical protein
VGIRALVELRDILREAANETLNTLLGKLDLFYLCAVAASVSNRASVQFKKNIALVLKYFDQLVPFVQEQDLKLRPAD